MSFLKNRTVVGVICIMLSLLICFGLTPLFNQSLSQKAEIVRVVQPIRAGDEITESMVQTVEVGGYNLPEDVLRQKESAVGKYATADLAVGDYIIPSKLSDAPAAENAYLYSLDGSQQAISVSIKSFAEGLSGKLQSGDIVSVIAPDYKQQGQTVVPAELQYVEIISVTASSGYNAGGYGYYVMIDHSNGLSTLYGHNSRLLAQVGQTVEAGDIVALSGSTGRSNRPQNPRKSKAEGSGLRQSEQ